MDNMLDILKRNDQLMTEVAKEELRKCNDFTCEYGLRLQENEINELVIGRVLALKESDRVEFEGGILPKIIYTFCDSPYMEQDNYKDTLLELQKAFYYYKSESFEQFTDDEIIDFMLCIYNGIAQGSIEYLVGTSLDTLSRYARSRKQDEEGDLF